MEIGRIIALGLVSTSLAVVLKKESPQFALLLTVVTGVLIFFMVFGYLEGLLQMARETAERAGVGSGYFAVVLRVIGIAYLTQFGAQLCVDAGETAIGSKIELAGKILMMAAAMPVLTALLEMVMNLF